MSPDKVGDVQVAQGDLAAALAAYQASLAIRERLADADPSNAGWQRDLSVSLEKLGDLKSARGDLDGALADFEQSLAIRRTPGRRRPEQRRLAARSGGLPRKAGRVLATRRRRNASARGAWGAGGDGDRRHPGAAGCLDA